MPEQKPEAERRLGIFGGTFDPVHNAHLTVAREARRRFGLERVLVVPNRLPPHKQEATGASYEDRLAMVRLACEGEEGLEASDIENHEAKSYTIQTLERLRNEYREPWEFYFVIGADAFAEVGLWYRVPEVLRMTRFIVVGRPGYEYPVPEGAQVVRLDGLELPVSATGIRARLAAGEAVDAEVPARVLQYIRGNNLYRKAAAAC